MSKPYSFKPTIGVRLHLDLCNKKTRNQRLTVTDAQCSSLPVVGMRDLQTRTPQCQFDQHPRVPPEVLALIFEYLHQHELAAAALVCTKFQHEAERILYRSVIIQDVDCHRLENCFESLASVPRRQVALRRLCIQYASRSQAFLQSARWLFPRISNLTELDIGVVGGGSTHILSACAFRLKTFSTDLPLDFKLLSFLDVQRDIRDLTLRFAHPLSIPSFEGMSIMPLLRRICAPGCIVSRLFTNRNRPIEVVDVLDLVSILQVKNGLLPAFKQSTKPVRDVTLRLEGCNKDVLMAIALSLPSLKRLDITDTRTNIPPGERCSHPLRVEMSWTDAFLLFKELEEIGFTTERKGARVMDDTTNQKMLVIAWGAKCTSLRKVRFGKGLMGYNWALVEGKWRLIFNTKK